MDRSCLQELSTQFPMLQSDRLLLRQVIQEDGEALHRILSEPLVSKYLLFRPETTRSKTRITRYFLECNKLLSSMHFVVLLKNTGRVVGLCSLQHLNRQEKSASMGYMVEPEHWNCGIATEAAQLLLQFAFESLKLQEVYAYCESDNTASCRVMDKCGFTLGADQKEKGAKRYLLHK